MHVSIHVQLVTENVNNLSMHSVDILYNQISLAPIWITTYVFTSTSTNNMFFFNV